MGALATVASEVDCLFVLFARFLFFWLDPKMFLFFWLDPKEPKDQGYHYESYKFASRS